MLKHKLLIPIIVLTIAALFFSGCVGQASQQPRPSSKPTHPAAPTASPSPVPPTVTSVPLAAIVNSDGILLADFQRELSRLQAALAEQGQTLPEQEAQKLVMDNLINQTLLALGAAQAGLTLTPEDVQKQIDQLIAQSGGTEAFTAWLEAQGYTEDEFRFSLFRSMSAAWMRDKIIAQVPKSAEQVHVRQIFVYNEEQAQQILELLRNGTEFGTLAYQYDSQSGGDLGWFPRGYIFNQTIEDTAFALQPGEFSDSIHTDDGFHIIQVVDRQLDRELTTQMRLTLQARLLQQWIQDQRDISNIQIFEGSGQ